jgi:O-antigen ligase
LCAFAMTGVLALRRGPVRLEKPLLAMLGFSAIFLAQGLIAAYGAIPGDFHAALAWSMVAAVAVTLLPDRFGGRWHLTHGSAVSALALIFVAVQAVAYLFQFRKAWLFSNIHYLALYSVITLPILYYLALNARAARRGVFVLALAGDFWLLLKTQSRPGFLALLAGALVVIPFLSARSRYVALGAVLLIPGILYATDGFGFATRIDDLMIHFFQEERLAIWRETLAIQAKSSWVEWWFGHGLGQFFRDYQAISSFHQERHEDYFSPHNYFLDLLYSHGIVGLILFLIAYGLFYGKLAAMVLSSRDSSLRALGILLISVTTADLVHTFLTLPFFSRHNLYPLSLIVGAGLRYFRNDRRRD